ncbi:MAG: IS3 family transposase [Clostridia bacterium]|nr:IS3 family transposase [Clostridia bacterium]
MGYETSTVLRIIDLNASTYYYAMNRNDDEKEETGGRPIPGYAYTTEDKKVCDMQIKEYILTLIEGECFAYGYYKLAVELRRTYKLIINKKKVYRLCKEMGVLRPQRKIKSKYPRKLAMNRTVTAPNQLWETDIKYGYVAGEDRFFYIQSIIDVYDREIIDYHIGLRCEGEDAAATLVRALMRRKRFEVDIKPVVRSDNGPQFISHKFEDKCIETGVEHERIPCKTPNKNAHVESFHRILEDECLGRWEFESYKEAYEAVLEFMERYNHRRIHRSIFNMSPVEFHIATLNGTAGSLIVTL